MAWTTKRTKTNATPGFAIKADHDTDLGLAILMAIYKNHYSAQGAKV